MIEGGGTSVIGSMGILLYMKLILCSGFSEIYPQLEEGWGQSPMGRSAFFHMGYLFGVVVLQRSMFNWRRVVVSVCHGYMCILLYVKLIQCSDFPEMYP